MDIDLSPDNKVQILISLCPKMGISMEEILSLYLVLGDRVFFLFDMFQGKSIKFPSMRSFHHAISGLSNVSVKKLKKYHYLINGVDSYSHDIKPGDVVHVEGVDVIAFNSPQEIFGETYLMCKVKE